MSLIILPIITTYFQHAIDIDIKFGVHCVPSINTAKKRRAPRLTGLNSLATLKLCVLVVATSACNL